MDLISYRGPGVAGGVSSGLGAVWRGQAETHSRWWYMNKDVFEMRASDKETSNFIALFPESLVEGHYRYCNEFLWPLMHDLPQYASYSEEKHQRYNAFNKLMAEQIDVESAGTSKHFVQDYQLALVPQWLGLFGHGSVVFWHIPWPVSVPAEFVEPLKEIAYGLLGAEAVGFHTEEYAENFMRFVQENISGYRTFPELLTIYKETDTPAPVLQTGIKTSHKPFVMQERKSSRQMKQCRLLVHPLGIDFKFWQDMKDQGVSQQTAKNFASLTNSNFILSVDRVDYTKAVYDRILIIDKFFTEHPEWVGHVTFAQVSGRSRAGLPAFDSYFQTCKSLYGSLNNTWRQDNWQPLVWIEQSLNPADLSYLYNHATALMVNAVRDGLNLTAKEFVACQDSNPGALILSPGAGAWTELKDQALPASPKDYDQSVQSIIRSLAMPLWERHQRSLRMKTTIAANQLSDWWTRFSQVAHAQEPAAAETTFKKTAQLG